MDTFADLLSPLGPDLLLRHFSATEALNEPFTFQVTAASPKADLPFADLLGKHVSVRVAPAVAGAKPRHFDGLVEQVTALGPQGRHHLWQLTLRPWFWFLTQTQDCRIFQDRSVLQILEAVLADHPIAAVDDRTTATFTPWLYCVQYRESDFNFLSRLLEQEGIGYHFEHEAGRHVMVLTDSVGGHPKGVGCQPLPVRHQAVAGEGPRECAFELSASRRIVPGATVIQDYDFTRSQTDLRQARAQPAPHALGDYEVFDYPGYYDKEGDGEQFVRSQMEEYAAAAEQLEGRSDARGLACGALVSFKGATRPADDAEHLVLATQIRVDVAAWEAGGGELAVPWTCAFRALRSAVPWRPPRRTPKPVVQGPQTAVVTGPEGEEIHTDKYGRVKLQFHWDRYGQRDERSSCWVRVSSPWAGKSFGFVQVPRIGQEVVVDFLEGDPDQPLVTGRVYNAQNMPPWELPAHATQSGVLTRSSKGGAYGNANAIRFEDKKGAEQLWIHAEKNQDIEVENDETHWVGHDRRKTVDHDETVLVQHDRTETVGNDETITVARHRSETVGVNETVAIGANRTMSVGGSEALSVGLQRTHTVGVNETIAIGAAQEVAIGAAQTVAIGAFQSVTVGADQDLSVGAAQSLSVGAAQSVTVGADASLTVGGARRAQVAKDDALQVGKNLVIEAGDAITFKTGSASITMKKDGTIVIKGKDITIEGSGKIGVKASSDLVMKGSKIAQN